MEFTTKEKFLAAWDCGQLRYLGKMGKVIEFPELKSELDLADSILTGGFDHGIYVFDTFVLQDDPEDESATFEYDNLCSFARSPIWCLYDIKKNKIMDIPERMSNPMAYELMERSKGVYAFNGVSTENMIIVKIKSMTKLQDSPYTLENVMKHKQFVYASIGGVYTNLLYTYNYVDPQKLDQYAVKYYENGYVIMDVLGCNKKIGVFNLVFKGNTIRAKQGGNLLCDKGKSTLDKIIRNPVFDYYMKKTMEDQ